MFLSHPRDPGATSSSGTGSTYLCPVLSLQMFGPFVGAISMNPRNSILAAAAALILIPFLFFSLPLTFNLSLISFKNLSLSPLPCLCFFLSLCYWLYGQTL